MKKFKLKKLIILNCILFLGSSLLKADAITSLARELLKDQKAPIINKIAILPFPYHDGKVSSGSTIVAEQLTTSMAKKHGIEVIERSLLNKVLEEFKLEKTGIIDQKSTKEIGKILGVEAIVSGTLIDLSKSKTEINARLIQVETGKVLSAGVRTIERTWTDEPIEVKHVNEEKEEGTEQDQRPIILDGSLEYVFIMDYIGLIRSIKENYARYKKTNNTQFGDERELIIELMTCLRITNRDLLVGLKDIEKYKSNKNLIINKIVEAIIPILALKMNLNDKSIKMFENIYGSKEFNQGKMMNELSEISAGQESANQSLFYTSVTVTYIFGSNELVPNTKEYYLSMTSDEKQNILDEIVQIFGEKAKKGIKTGESYIDSCGAVLYQALSKDWKTKK